MHAGGSIPWFPKVLVLLPALTFLAGCRFEVGRSTSPTPTPTATATATPTATVTNSTTSTSESSISAATETATPSSATSATNSTNSSLSASVASAEAAYFEEATTTAAEETSALRRALARATATNGETKIRLLEAKESLSAALDAYRKAEATVFFVDPESVEELRAQPDPLGAGSLAGTNDAINELSSSLDKMDELLSQPLDDALAGTLLEQANSLAAQTEKLEAGLHGLADAWESGASDNFRGKFFLSSAEGAVARVFQGLLAMTGDLIPGKLSSSDDPAEISSRLRSVREIYLGDSDDSGSGPSLHALVQEASPVQAALTRASIARASALAGVLEIAPDDTSVRSQLGTSLEDLTRQLTFAASSLGIVIVSEQGN